MLRVEAVDEHHHLMRACLTSLPPEDREVLMLAGWEGLSATAMGQVLGCSPTAARIRLHRARARLKAAMTGDVRAPKRPGVAGHEEDEEASRRPDPEEAVER